MDPKVFLETGQTNGKNVSGNANDTSGETAKQAGKAFKEAFNAANAARQLDSTATTTAGNVDPKASAPGGKIEPSATAAAENFNYTATATTANVDSLARDLTAKAPIDNEKSESARPLRYGKSLPQSQQTGNLGPSEGKFGSDLVLDSNALINGAKAEVDSQGLLTDAWQASSSELTSAKLEVFGSPPLFSKTDKVGVVRVKSPQGLMEIALPNGPASLREVSEFMKSQSLPSRFTRQVLGSFDEGAVRAPGDPLLHEQKTAAISVYEADAGAVELESALSANTPREPAVGLFNQIENLVGSEIFIDKLASSLAPKIGGELLKQQSGETEHSQSATLIKKTLSSLESYDTKVKLVTDELSSEAIKIRGAVIEAIGADQSMKLSDFDVNKLANLLEPKFVSAVSASGVVAVKTQPKSEAIRVAQLPGAGNFWSLNDNGDLNTNKAQSDAKYRFGDLPAAASTFDRPRQTEFDSSIIAAQKLVGPSPEVQGSSRSKFEILDVEAVKVEKTLTSNEALNLRNFANNRSTGDSSTARPLSGNSSAAQVSPESQSLFSAAPVTNAVGDYVNLNSFASSGLGYPLVSRSTNSEGFRATQYQSSFQPVRDAFALSERFTQVLTERLVQNVKSGNYNLRFNLHPRELGAVDIAMEVRDGRLDAQISSANPVTRDLLSESLPRLRDALQAGGLQLSNLEVNDNARENQKRGLMSSQEHDHSAVEANETATKLLVEDLTLDAESVDYLA